MTTYKVLDENMRSMHGGRAKWTPGRKKTVKGDLIPCANGLHYCRDEVELLTWLGPVICECEVSVEHVDARDKGVARWIRIAEPNQYWNERTARHFACDCAEYVLQYAQDGQRELLQACIDVTRAYADWPEEWAAAWSAAWDAARTAARTVARDATWAAAREDTWAAARAAARDAARDATWAAARDIARAAREAARAAREAAREAAWNIAWAAARADIAVIFATYLNGTSEWVCEQKGER